MYNSTNIIIRDCDIQAVIFSTVKYYEEYITIFCGIFFLLKCFCCTLISANHVMWHFVTPI